MCYQGTVSVISKYLGRLEAAEHKYGYDKCRNTPENDAQRM